MNPNITIDVINHRGDLRMTWANYVTDADITTAFKTITNHLNNAEDPLHIIVDMSLNPQIPIPSTLREVMSGPARHPSMGQWLCVGENRHAKTIAKVMDAVQRESHVTWYDTLTEAEAALVELTREASQ